MSQHKVFSDLNDRIESAMSVRHLERESRQIAHFINKHGERFHYDAQKKRFFINSFYPSFPGKAWTRFILGGKKIVKDNTRIPIQADIVVTGKCHCNCWHCFRIKDKREDLSLKEIERVMGELYALGTATVGITGGEPMLREDIRDILKLIPEGMEGQLYTTGHQIDKNFAEFIQSTNVTRVIVSLDHYLEDAANAMRHYGHAYEEAVKAIQCLVSSGVYTAVTVCITENLLNEEKLTTYFRLVSSLGLNEIRIILPIPQGNLEGRRVSRIYSDAIKYIKNIKKKYEKDISFPGILNFCEFESPDYLGCSAGANYISINNDGLVTPCVAVPLSFGKIRKKHLKDIFEEMKRYFPKSGRICYGKLSGRAMSGMDVDTRVTPLGVEDSAQVACRCAKSKRRAALFDCFNLK